MPDGDPPSAAAFIVDTVADVANIMVSEVPMVAVALSVGKLIVEILAPVCVLEDLGREGMEKLFVKVALAYTTGSCWFLLPSLTGHRW